MAFIPRTRREIDDLKHVSLTHSTSEDCCHSYAAWNFTVSCGAIGWGCASLHMGQAVSKIQCRPQGGMVSNRLFFLYVWLANSLESICQPVGLVDVLNLTCGTRLLNCRRTTRQDGNILMEAVPSLGGFTFRQERLFTKLKTKRPSLSQSCIGIEFFFVTSFF